MSHLSASNVVDHHDRVGPSYSTTSASITLPPPLPDSIHVAAVTDNKSVTSTAAPAPPPPRHGLIQMLQEVEAMCLANSEAYLQRALPETEAKSFHLTLGEPFRESPDEPLTVFHTAGYVKMTLAELAASLQRHTRSSTEEIAIAAILCCRFAQTTEQPITRHMMHRLFVAALHVGVKAHGERYFAMSAMARAAGLQPVEMRRLESHFFRGVAGRCAVLLSRRMLDSARGCALAALCLMGEAAVCFAPRVAPLRPELAADQPRLAALCQSPVSFYVPSGPASHTAMPATGNSPLVRSLQRSGAE